MGSRFELQMSPRDPQYFLSLFSRRVRGVYAHVVARDRLLKASYWYSFVRP